MGDDDGDEVDAALVVVVALVTRTVGWVLRDGAVLWHGELGLCVFVGGRSHMCWRDDKAFNAAKIQHFFKFSKFFVANCLTLKNVDQKSTLLWEY